MNDIQSVNMEQIIDLKWNTERDEMEIDCCGKMKQGMEYELQHDIRNWDCNCMEYGV